MPSISVELFKGRTIEQRRAFVAAVTQAAVDHLDARQEGVRIRLIEMDREDVARNGRLLSD